MLLLSAPRPVEIRRAISHSYLSRPSLRSIYIYIYRTTMSTIPYIRLSCICVFLYSMPWWKLPRDLGEKKQRATSQPKEPDGDRTSPVASPARPRAYRLDAQLFSPTARVPGAGRSSYPNLTWRGPRSYRKICKDMGFGARTNLVCLKIGYGSSKMVGVHFVSYSTTPPRQGAGTSQPVLF